MHAKVIRTNKSLFVLGSLCKEGMSQEEVDHLFNAIVLPNFSYALSVYGASDTEFFRLVYEKKVYVQECKYQGLVREGGRDTPQNKIEQPRVSVLPVFT